MDDDTTEDENEDDGNTIIGDAGDVAAFYPGASQEFLDDFTYTRGVVSGHRADVSGDNPETEDVVETTTPKMMPSVTASSLMGSSMRCTTRITTTTTTGHGNVPHATDPAACYGDG